MAVIKSGASTDELTVDPTSKAARTTLYDSAGGAIGASNPLAVMQRVVDGTLVGDYSVTTFRTVGLASTPHNLFTIWNPAASGRNIALRVLLMEVDHTTLLATTLQAITSHPTAQPSGGTLITPHKFVAGASASIAEVRGATASDGGGATAITATAGSVRVWSNFVQRPPSLAGWFTSDRAFMIPEQCASTPIILAPGDGILLNTVQAATTGAFYLVRAMWEEYTA